MPKQSRGDLGFTHVLMHTQSCEDAFQYQHKALHFRKAPTSTTTPTTKCNNFNYLRIILSLQSFKSTSPLHKLAPARSNTALLLHKKNCCPIQRATMFNLAPQQTQTGLRTNPTRPARAPTPYLLPPQPAVVNPPRERAIQANERHSGNPRCVK